MWLNGNRFSNTALPLAQPLANIKSHHLPGVGLAIQGMLNSLKSNKALLRPKRPFLNQKKRYFKSENGKIKVKRLSETELNEIRYKLKKENRKDRIKGISIPIIIIIPLIIIISLGIQNQIEVGEKFKRSVFLKKKERYIKLIQDGDQWLENRKWYNAIFQYKKAKEIFPIEYDIHYRLAYAQCLRCENEFLNCKEAKKELDRLIKDFPEKTKLLVLKGMLEYEY